MLRVSFEGSNQIFGEQTPTRVSIYYTSGLVDLFKFVYFSLRGFAEANGGGAIYHLKFQINHNIIDKMAYASDGLPNTSMSHGWAKS